MSPHPSRSDPVAVDRRAARQGGRERRFRHRGHRRGLRRTSCPTRSSTSTTARPTTPPPAPSRSARAHPQVRLIRHPDQRRPVGGDPQRRRLRPRPGDLHPRRRRPEPARRGISGAHRPARRRAAFPEGVALVAGQRVGRRDSASKRWASLPRQRHPPGHPEGRYPRHRLRAEAHPPRCLPRPALLRPHAPLPAGAGRPRRLASAPRRCRPRAPPCRASNYANLEPGAGRDLRPRRRDVADQAPQEGARPEGRELGSTEA